MNLTREVLAFPDLSHAPSSSATRYFPGPTKAMVIGLFFVGAGTIASPVASTDATSVPFSTYRSSPTMTAKTSSPVKTPQPQVHQKTGAEIKRLREISGLTWEQIGRVFEVSRRSVHLWANEGRMNSRNIERLNDFAALVDAAPGSTPNERRTWLLRTAGNESSPLDSFRAGLRTHTYVNRPIHNAFDGIASERTER